MASSCCWLPPVLILLGVSGAGIVSALEEFRAVFMVVTFGFLGTAFYFTYRPRVQQEDCCAPAKTAGRRRFNMMTANKIMLWAVTAMVIVFLFFPGLVTNMLASSGELTDDMHHTVLKVVGMTCPG